MRQKQDDYKLFKTKESIEQAAAEKGLFCFFPLDDELHLDLDDGMVMNDRVFDILNANGFKVKSSLPTVSASGYGQHYYLKLDKGISAYTRIAMQTTLGSDPVKECLSLLALEAGSEYYAALFETIDEAVNVAKWRKDLS